MNELLIDVLLKEGYLVITDNIGKKEHKKETLAILNSFLSIGYMLDEKSFNLVTKLSKKDLTDFYNKYFKLLKKIKGVKKHVVFYNDFPHLENVSEFEFIIRANLHYLTATSASFGFMNQDNKKEVKEEDNNEEAHYDNLTIIKESEAIIYLKNYFTNLFRANKAINRNLIEAIKYYRVHYKLGEIEEIPFKENIAIYINTKVEPKNISYDKLNFVKTVTDVLRIYTILASNKSVLETKVKFVSLPRPTRRNMVKKLEEIIIKNKDVETDFKRHIKLWKHAFNYLHIFEYKDMAPNTYHIADLIRNNKLVTFNSKLEMNKENQVTYLKLLSQKPGEFARKIISIINNKNYDLDITLTYFNKIVSMISTKVLVELYNTIINYNKHNFRLFKIPSSYYTLYFELDEAPNYLDLEIAEKLKVSIINGLRNKFSSYRKMDNVYVDPNLKNVFIAPNIRNSSFNYNNLYYGSRVKLDNKNFIRCFTTWKNEGDIREDIDLSLEVYDDNFKQVASLAWHNMSGGKEFDAYHSGDLITAPKKAGATEFVDINLVKAKSFARYLVVVNTIYAGLSFNELNYCYSGVMLTNERLNKHYDEKLVYIKSKLNQEKALMNASFIIDLKEMELIWLDVPIKSYYANTAFGELGTKATLVDALKERMNYYDFIMLHDKHINFIDNKDNCEILISNQKDATFNPINLEKFMLEFF